LELTEFYRVFLFFGQTFQRLMQFVLLCASAIAVNGVNHATTLAMALPIVGVFYLLQRFFRTSARELQRLESLTKGPVVSHLTETLAGLATIRAFGQQKRYFLDLFRFFFRRESFPQKLGRLGGNGVSPAPLRC